MASSPRVINGSNRSVLGGAPLAEARVSLPQQQPCCGAEAGCGCRGIVLLRKQVCGTCETAV